MKCEPNSTLTNMQYQQKIFIIYNMDIYKTKMDIILNLCGI